MKKSVIQFVLMLLFFFSFLCFIWNVLQHPTFINITGLIFTLFGTIISLYSLDDFDDFIE
jgi:membrane protein YdbS with pleckstrin-like domain